MIDKEVTFKIIDYKIFDEVFLEKTASVNTNDNSLINSLPEPYDPDYLYVRVRAVSAGEYWGCNRNSDYFSEKELRDHHHTFLDAHVFKNHENKDVAKAIGSIISSEWNNVMKYVELLIKIDRELAPTIVRGFLKGSTTDVSMGARVSHTICSFCNNKAKTRKDFCVHVRTMRGQVLPNGIKVMEYNYGPRFHDLSVVLSGADKTAKMVELLDVIKQKGSNTPMKKTAFTIPQEAFLEKVASAEETPPLFFSKKASLNLNKLAEIQKQIVDKLYTLAIRSRLEANPIPKEIEEVVDSFKDTPTALHVELSKSAGVISDLGYMTMGATGAGLLTNYYQGKRLRGSELTGTENFIADNPGLLPLAYLLSYPKLKNLSKKLTLKKADLDDYKIFLEKEATLSTINAINVFGSKDIAEIFKSSYYVEDDSMLPMLKVAVTLHAAGEEKLAGEIQTYFNITDDNITNFLKTSFAYIEESLNKEAALLRSIVEMNVLSNPKLPLGRTAPAMAGAIIDGIIINKFFSPDRDIPLKKN